MHCLTAAVFFYRVFQFLSLLPLGLVAAKSCLYEGNPDWRNCDRGSKITSWGGGIEAKQERKSTKQCLPSYLCQSSPSVCLLFLILSYCLLIVFSFSFPFFSFCLAILPSLIYS